MNIYKIFRPLIFKTDSEKAHEMAIFYLKNFANLATLFAYNKNYSTLNQQVCGLNFQNPVGLSAGFDKNGEIIKAISRFGFGFTEVGTVTPKPQIGNEKPRIFRLTQDKALINRLGFNNKGSEEFSKNISRFKAQKSAQNNKQNDYNLIIGVNIGKNKESINGVDDYLFLLEKFYQEASYITLNISSPNTKNLRDLQKYNNLDDFLSQIMQKRQELQQKKQKYTPIWLKIAPDINNKEQEEIAQLVIKNKIDAVIISNTTISRPKYLQSNNQERQGGLSGKPVFFKSNEVLCNFYRLTQGKIPLIGVGGIFSAEDAYCKIKNGASLVQIYSALIYQGFSTIEEINSGLNKLLKQDGFDNISQAIGVEVR